MTEKGEEEKVKKCHTKIGKEGDVEKYMLFFLVSLQTNVKLYHWKTSSYDKHKITDELYNTLSNEIDSFVEVYQGQMKVREKLKYNQPENCILGNVEEKDFVNYLSKCLEKIEKIKKNNSDKTQIVNILDNMVASINKAMYLMSLN